MKKTAVLFLFILAGTGIGQDAGQVTLPLDSYLELIAKIEQNQRDREADQHAEPTIAEITTQHLSLTFGEDHAEFISELQISLRGRQSKPIDIPRLGAAETIEIEPELDASIDFGQKYFRFAALNPGDYRIRIKGKIALDESGAEQKLSLPAFHAPVSLLNLDLPADFSWRCDKTVTVEEVERAGRRHVTLAPEKGSTLRLSIGRIASGVEDLLAQSVVATLVKVDEYGFQRSDIVFLDVTRGSIDEFKLTVPESLELERIATDEDAPPTTFRKGRSLTVSRKQKASEWPFAALSSTIRGEGPYPLDPIIPDAPVRNRFLVLASGITAEVRPLPAESWIKVDLGDLPQKLREAIGPLKLAVAWRFDKEKGPATLAVNRFPEAVPLETVVAQRTTTTAWTLDGMMATRETIKLARENTVLAMTLPPGARLWTTLVNNQPVRPITRGDRLLIPLPFREHGGSVVQLVTVREQVQPKRRSILKLDLAQLDAPVLSHSWELFLPEGKKYRFLAGSLRPVAHSAVEAVAAARSIGKMIVLETEDAPTPSQQKSEMESQSKDPWSEIMTVPGIQTDRINVGGSENSQNTSFAGVKPIQVELPVPEKGKRILLAEALPPMTVSVELEIK